MSIGRIQRRDACGGRDDRRWGFDSRSAAVSIFDRPRKSCDKRSLARDHDITEVFEQISTWFVYTLIRRLFIPMQRILA